MKSIGVFFLHVFLLSFVQLQERDKYSRMVFNFQKDLTEIQAVCLKCLPLWHMHSCDVPWVNHVSLPCLVQWSPSFLCFLFFFFGGGGGANLHVLLLSSDVNFRVLSLSLSLSLSLRFLTHQQVTEEQQQRKQLQVSVASCHGYSEALSIIFGQTIAKSMLGGFGQCGSHSDTRIW